MHHIISLTHCKALILEKIMYIARQKWFEKQGSVYRYVTAFQITFNTARWALSSPLIHCTALYLRKVCTYHKAKWFLKDRSVHKVREDFQNHFNTARCITSYLSHTAKHWFWKRLCILQGKMTFERPERT